MAAVMAMLVLGGCRPADRVQRELEAADAYGHDEHDAAEPSASSTPYSMDDY